MMMKNLARRISQLSIVFAFVLGTVATSTADPEAPGKCQALLDAFCASFVTCFEGAISQSDCLDIMTEELDCNSAVAIEGDVVACTADAEDVECETLIEEEPALPASCDDVTIYVDEEG